MDLYLTGYKVFYNITKNVQFQLCQNYLTYNAPIMKPYFI